MSRLLPVDEFDLVIFGGTGDLAMRKLLPALYHRHSDEQFIADSRIIAIGRGAMESAELLQIVEKSLGKNLASSEFDEED